jgi:hypothetical protein
MKAVMPSAGFGVSAVRAITVNTSALSAFVM